MKINLTSILTFSFLLTCGCASHHPPESKKTESVSKSVAPTVKFKPELVVFPAQYKKDYVEYAVVDRYDNKEIRKMYAKKELLNGKYTTVPLPYGAQLVMVSEKPKITDKGDFERDDKGRFISTGEVTKITVMQKEKGWGQQYPEYLQNGEWEYAVFDSIGKLKSGTDYAKCMNCHTSRESHDYHFSLFEYLNQKNIAKK
jgi:hypothetical protein